MPPLRAASSGNVTNVALGLIRGPTIFPSLKV